MGRFIKKAITLLLLASAGFWVYDSGYLSSARLSQWIGNIAGGLQEFSSELTGFSASLVDQLSQEPDPSASSATAGSETPEFSSSFVITDSFSFPAEVDEPLIEQTILELLNKLRSEQGLTKLTQNETLTAAAEIRAAETAESFSHTRPDGSEFFTVAQEEATYYHYQMIGENLAMGTYYMEEEEMAAFLFDGWVNSEGHYANMVEPAYREVGLGVYYDGEYLYLTQLFGTPQ